jgi:hypothetical protein
LVITFVNIEQYVQVVRKMNAVRTEKISKHHPVYVKGVDDKSIRCSVRGHDVECLMKRNGVVIDHLSDTVEQRFQELFH